MLYLLDSAGGAVAPTYEVRFVPKEAVTHHLDQKSTLQDRYVSYKVGIVKRHSTNTQYESGHIQERKSHMFH